MFLKPYKLKSNAPLKGSEAKRLRQRVEKSFSHLNEEQLQLLLPAKGHVTVLKIVTHGDFTTNVFCVDKLPLFFEIELEVLVPTLYAMWQVPELLPYFTTFPAVLPKLSNGADLMLPGVVPQGTGTTMYGRFKKNQLVAINLTSNKSAVAVGMLPRSSDDLYMCGGRGTAVKMLHIFGDKLWGHEPALAQQVPNNKVAPPKAEDFPSLGESMLKKEKSTENREARSEENASATAESDQLADMINLEIAEKVAAEVNQSTPDENLRNAFLCALKNHGRTLQLPLLTSNFYRVYVVPEAQQPIDLKQTKYKKLSNFLNEMVDQGFIVVREEAKGVDKITSIDLQHPELVNFITDCKVNDANSAGANDQPLFHSELTELYIVTDETAPFFTKMNYKRGEGIPSTTIRKVIREYISKNNLPVVDNVTKAIKLDECLEKICECSQAPLNRICSLVLEQMEHSYEMRSIKDVSTNKPQIQMSLATRSGNKKVTLVSNIECYGIILPEFIKLCKQGAAASTTVVKLPNQKRELLQIQGNQVRFIYNLLTETYKVPPQCILGLELAKDGKKHKKK